MHDIFTFCKLTESYITAAMKACNMEKIMKYDIDCGCMKERSDYYVKVLTSGDEVNTMKLIYTFLDKEPINAVMEFSEDFKAILSRKLYEMCVPTQWSLGMIHKGTGCLAGIFLGALHSKNSTVNFELPREMRVLNEFNKGVDLYKQFKVDKYFDTFVCVVDPKFQRQGIQGELMALLEHVAADCDAKLMTCTATSAYSYRNHCKLGYDVVRELKYAEFVDPHSGKKTFEKIPPPHTGARIMIKWLSN